MSKQIIAIGGGGFGAEQSSLAFERYLCQQVGKPRPKVCFLPQASNEAADYIVRFYDAFTKLGAV
ncbi:MAG: Type 1 glutamine amidotransferase-like domain-containing protein, partial [Pseudomonadota bacterium]